MNLEGKIVGNKYHIISRECEDSIIIKWYGTSIVSGSKVELLFLKRKLDTYDSGALSDLKAKISNLTRLDHAGLVRLIEYGEFEGYFYAVKEQFTGIILDDYIKNHPSMSLRELLFLFIGIAQAVRYMHQNDSVCGNLDAQNIIVKEHLGEVYQLKIDNPGLYVFGEQLMRRSEGKTDKTAYIRGSQVPDVQDDIVSLGRILYMLLTCKNYKGRSKQEKPVMPSEINPSYPHILDIIVSQLLEEIPENRFNDIDYFTMLLTSICKGEKIPSYYLDEIDLFVKKGASIEDVPEVKSHVRKASRQKIEEMEAVPAGNELKIKTISQLKQSDVEYNGDIRILFHNTMKSRGAVALIDFETGMKRKSLFEYFYYYVIYNGGLFINIECDESKAGIDFYLLKVFLREFLKVIDETEPDERAGTKDKLTRLLGPTLKSFIKSVPSISGLIQESDDRVKKASEIYINDEFLSESVSLMFSLLKLKYPAVLLIHDVESIDNYSNILLAELSKKVEKKPILFLGIRNPIL
jgi:serine/threonine protein kinase